MSTEQQTTNQNSSTEIKKPTWQASTPGGYVPVKAEHLLHGVTKTRVDALVGVTTTMTNYTNTNTNNQDAATASTEETVNKNENTNNNNNDDDDTKSTTTSATTKETKLKGMWTGAERANPTAGAAKTERPTFEGEINFMNFESIKKTKHMTKAKNEYFNVSQAVCQSAWSRVQHEKAEANAAKAAAAKAAAATTSSTSVEETKPATTDAAAPSTNNTTESSSTTTTTTSTTTLPERREREEENKTEPQQQQESTTSADAAVPAPNKDQTEGTCGARTHVNEILRLRALDDEPKELRRKRLFDNKLILAPLTTVGNLPYRRICKELGADVTCGEMALSYNLNQLQKSEWSLLRRHESEDVFGLQIAASRGGDAALTSALLHELNFSYDFLDINVCCPVGLICKNGCGCGLFDKKNRMREVVQSMYHFQTKPVTIKSLIGPDERAPILHKQIQEYESWGAEAVIVHGRSYRQRYTKSSNWDYVEDCAKLTRLPLIGNGDILSWEDVVERKQFCPNVSGLMIGRGALVKPWIFEEIKEQKVKDISSHERFEMLKKYCKYGLAHWGADEKGIATTRRFLLEWLSFLCRYVPVGLMEYLPQRINDRPPLYQGRDDMETLLSSDNVKDWIKVSEMLLGPVGDKFQFTPKHKSNSYSVTDAEKKEMVTMGSVETSSQGASSASTTNETQPNMNVVATM